MTEHQYHQALAALQRMSGRSADYCVVLAVLQRLYAERKG